MTIEYDKIKCATCGKIIHREKRLINMCANSFCNKECRQKYRKIKNISIVLLLLFLNNIIIYNQYGEPQKILKGHIVYDSYGIAKSYTQAKTSMPNVYKEQRDKSNRIYCSKTLYRENNCKNSY